MFALRWSRTTPLLLALLLLVSTPGFSSTSEAASTPSNPITPGNLTGFGFDQCEAPSQTSMDRWMTSSPFLAAGIYISGNSRACRTQRNLTPTWVTNQLAAGWHLMPITLGPQASCSDRFPRYSKTYDPTIDPRSTNAYAAARGQGRAEANKSVLAAQALGIVPGSTMFYDLEGFNIRSSTYCTNSALAFMSEWTNQLHRLGYLSGFYSSASSGIALMERERLNRASTITLPDQLWIADWNRIPNTRTTYISDAGWTPHSRAHQYQGGHNETYGGVRINIDRNWVDLGLGSVAPADGKHCGGINIDLSRYFSIGRGTKQGDQVMALKCRLREVGAYQSRWMGPNFNRGLIVAIRRYQAAHKLPVTNMWWRTSWTVLLTDAPHRTVKFGSADPSVRLVQRAMNAAMQSRLSITGFFDAATQAAVMSYQRGLRLPEVNGVVSDAVWAKLAAGAVPVS